MHKCNYGNLLDDARALLLSAPLDVPKVAAAIGKLIACADDARTAGDAATQQRLSSAAAELERRLFET